MTEVEQITQRLRQMDPERRQAWTGYILRQLEESEADPWDDLSEKETERVRALIQQGIDSGPAVPGAEVFSELRERYRRRADESRHR